MNPVHDKGSSSLLRRAAFNIDNYAKYSGVLKNVLYTRMNAVLTLFVLAESTQVK